MRNCVFCETLPNERQLAFIHRIDSILFAHGGLAAGFVDRYIPAKMRDDIETVIETINGFDYS